MNNAIGQGNVGAQSEIASQMAPYQQLSMLGGMSGQSPNPQSTQYLPAAMAAYQGAMQRYGIDQASKNSAMSGGANLAAMAAM